MVFLNKQAYFTISIVPVVVLFIFWKRGRRFKSKRFASEYWFKDLHQTVQSALTNTKEEDWQEFDPHSLYSKDISYFHGIQLPPIFENTEGIAGVHDLWIPEDSKTLVDIGSGKSNAVKDWLENKYPGLTVYSLDPFQRPHEHNAQVQQIIVSLGGVDIATSISVLNVINNKLSRMDHIALLHHILKVGGVAYFKIWAGKWPDRGTGKSFHDIARNSFQANEWASSFLEEIEEIFGLGNVVADNNRNLLIGKKVSPVDDSNAMMRWQQR